MSLLQCRQDIATVLQAIKTAWVAYPLVIDTDNRNLVDYSVQANPFLQVDTIYLSADQLDLSANPKVKQYGQLILSVVAKDGTGVVDILTLLEFITPYFDMKDFSSARFHAGEVYKPKVVNGWYYQPVLFNFWFIR